jgi:glycine dehydrogenase subunit 2
LVRAYAYILSLGPEGLRAVSETAVLNTNYVLTKVLERTKFELPYSRKRKHEFVLSAKKISEDGGVRALDIGKRMLDSGVHSPTVYFPQIVEEAMMVEPPETESLRDLDELVDAFVRTAKEAETDPERLRGAPHATSVGRIDEVKTSHPKTIKLKWDNPKLAVRSPSRDQSRPPGP